jgi:hypothetical protein
MQTSDFMQELIGGEWVNSIHTTRSYDNSNNLLQLFHHAYNNGQWRITLDIMHIYDANNNLVERRRGEWIGGVRREQSREVFTYDERGNELSVTYEGFKSGAWNPIRRFIYTYDSNNNRLTVLYQEHWVYDNKWHDRFQSWYTYDAFNNRIAGVERDFVEGKRYTDTLTYDASGNLLSRTFSWPEETWRLLYTYDASDNLLSELQQVWEGGEWLNGLRRSFMYDANNNLLSELQHDWVDGEWVNYRRRLYEYDANGNMLSISRHTWSNSSWVGDNDEDGVIISDSFGNCYYYPHFESGRVDSWGDSLALSYREIVTGIPNEVGPVPAAYSLHQNYPNPFNPSTTLEYALPRAGYVTLKVYNVLGEEVAILIAGDYPAGTFKATWDASGLPSGVYFYRLTAGEFVQTKKAVLTK